MISRILRTLFWAQAGCAAINILCICISPNWFSALGLAGNLLGMWICLDPRQD